MKDNHSDGFLLVDGVHVGPLSPRIPRHRMDGLGRHLVAVLLCFSGSHFHRMPSGEDSQSGGADV